MARTRPSIISEGAITSAPACASVTLIFASRGNVSSLRIWRRKYKDIEIALAKGRDVVDREVEETLFKKAIKGDTTAMIFWLKNRKPDEWRNFVERATKEDKEEQRARINRILLENEKLKAEIEKIRGETDRAQHDDGFLAALSAAAEEDWSNGDEDPS